MLSKNNWIDISWAGNIPRKYKEDIQCTFKEKTNEILNFDLACDLTAQEIASSYDNLYLAMSGGCDSEAVADVLYRNKIPFTPLLIQINELAKIESWHALHWCKKRNIIPHIINLSIDEYCAQIQRFSTKNLRMVTTVLPIYAAEYTTKLGGKLLTGHQLEYYPDHEQMIYLEPELKDYDGFTLTESDVYIECNEPNTHPWAFFYWSPSIMASFVNAWDTNLTIQENKEKIYNVPIRPKYHFNDFGSFIHGSKTHQIIKICSKIGTTEVFKLGDKQQLLNNLITKYGNINHSK
jgi:hypothetical protein